MLFRNNGKPGNTGTRLRIFAVAGAYSLIMTLSLPLAQAAGSVEPYVEKGNYKLSCEYGQYAFKIDPFSYGTHTDTKTNTSFIIKKGEYEKSFNWEIHYGGVTKVVVKGGPDTNLYHYEYPVDSGSGLYAPDNKGGQRSDVSHVTFCYEPAKASIEVTKKCLEQDQNKDYNSFTARNTVTIKNTGDIPLQKIWLEEKLDNCTIVEINGYLHEQKLYKDQPALLENITLDNKDDYATLIISCKTDDPNVVNHVQVKGETKYGKYVDSYAMSDPYQQCKFVYQPGVTVEKTCVDDSVHLQAVASESMKLLAVRVCPSITIYNNGNESLKDIKVTDASIPLLAEGYILKDVALYPHTEINLAEWLAEHDQYSTSDSLCYYPDVPRGHDGYPLPVLDETIEYDDRYAPDTAAFFNQVKVVATGYKSYTEVADDDTTYSYDEENHQWVAECPLCTRCPECDKDTEY